MFRLGNIYVTPGACSCEVDKLIDRHVHGDFGDIGPEDKELNQKAILEGGRIVSSYNTDIGTVLVITEEDTTVLLAEEY
jgi:hypothetical protein